MRTFIILFISLWVTKSPYAQESICGYITDAYKQGPYEGVTVYLHDEYNLALKEDRRTRTDSSGYFEFNNLEPGNYSVNAWTWVEFRDEQYAFVFQPGFIQVISDTLNNLYLPCYYVNFEFNLHIEEDTYEKYEADYIQSLRFFAKQTNIDPDSLNPDPWRVKSSAMVFSIQAKVSSTIDSLYTHAQSFYFRRPGNVN